MDKLLRASGETTFTSKNACRILLEKPIHLISLLASFSCWQICIEKPRLGELAAVVLFQLPHGLPLSYIEQVNLVIAGLSDILPVHERGPARTIQWQIT